jgi:hypothetical protein
MNPKEINYRGYILWQRGPDWFVRHASKPHAEYCGWSRKDVMTWANRQIAARANSLPAAILATGPL